MALEHTCQISKIQQDRTGNGMAKGCVVSTTCDAHNEEFWASLQLTGDDPINLA